MSDTRRHPTRGGIKMCDCSGYSQFSGRKVRTARKKHECGECQQPIRAGAKYIYWVGRWDDDRGSHFWTFKLCSGCDDDWDRVSDLRYEADGNACICYGELRKTISDAIAEGLLDEDDPLAQKWFPEEESPFEDPRQLHLPLFPTIESGVWATAQA
ncbi:MAG: hypothetical protein HYT42_00470 [Candidatus Sungbacteria bacterium]|nr:hypothetical protein [Candidatus Sungbacteria bacterium]